MTSFDDDTLHVDFAQREVTIHGRPVDLPPQTYLVLSTLVHRQGQPISIRELITLLWGDDPPRTAVKVVQSHVANLRHLLDPEGDGSVIELVPTGPSPDPTLATPETHGYRYCVR